MTCISILYSYTRIFRLVHVKQPACYDHTMLLVLYLFRQSDDVRTGSSGLCACMFHISAFLFQPGVRHSTVLCVVPPEEVSETFTLDTEITVTSVSEPQTLVFSRFEYMQRLYDSLPPEKLRNTPTVYVFDPLTPCIPPPSNPALCQSAAWSQSCRRKSGPTTQEWRGSTSTKGYECAAPSSKHCHNTAAGSVLASLPALLIQCAKVKFVSPHFHRSDGYLRTPSLSQSVSL